MSSTRKVVTTGIRAVPRKRTVSTTRFSPEEVVGGLLGNEGDQRIIVIKHLIDKGLLSEAECTEFTISVYRRGESYYILDDANREIQQSVVQNLILLRIVNRSMLPVVQTDGNVTYERGRWFLSGEGIKVQIYTWGTLYSFYKNKLPIPDSVSIATAHVPVDRFKVTKWSRSDVVGDLLGQAGSYRIVFAEKLIALKLLSHEETGGSLTAIICRIGSGYCVLGYPDRTLTTEQINGNILLKINGDHLLPLTREDGQLIKGESKGSGIGNGNSWNLMSGTKVYMWGRLKNMVKNTLCPVAAPSALVPATLQRMIDEAPELDLEQLSDGIAEYLEPASRRARII